MKKRTSKYDITGLTKEQIAIKYEPLVHKIVNQLRESSPHTEDDVLGYAWEGLAMAINNYNPNSTQNFMQYAAYQIRYNILNGNNAEGHTVKFSAYNQRKQLEAGASTWIMRRIKCQETDDGDCVYNIREPEVYNDAFREDPSVKIYNMIKDKFSKRDLDVFCRLYGLNNKKQVRGTELARKYKVTSTTISLINKKILNYIKSDKDLVDELRDYRQ